jgi:aspartyl-tRNA(Asn)/glutamyl-tRNA(Gln) amidotransferase subunit B
LIDLIHDGTISGRLAKDVFEVMADTGGDPEDIVNEKGLRQITDESAIEAAINNVIAANPEQAAQFKAGQGKVVGWFVGQVMKATEGKANPKQVNELLRKKLA